MIRVLRASHWTSMYRPPMTIVVRDSDVIDSLESVAAKAGDGSGFYVNDIFTVSGKGISIAEATMRAMRRVSADQEQNMAIMFFYVQSVIHALEANGVWAAPDPAPLTARQVTVVFDQLRDDSGRENQTLQSYSTEEDGSHKLITLSGDEITVDGEAV